MASEVSAPAGELNDVRPFPEAPAYMVNANGDIFCQRKATKKKKPWMDTTGYLRVSLKRPQDAKSAPHLFRVAYIVCRTFHGPPPTAQHTVDHLNRIRTDNRAVNLRWATPSEQAQNKANVKGVSRPCNNNACTVTQLDPLTLAPIATYASTTRAAQAMLAQGKTRSKDCHSTIRKGAQTGRKRFGYRWRIESKPGIETIEGEQWASVDGSVSHLCVSTLGRIKRTAGSNIGLVHCPTTHPVSVTNGYSHVSFRAVDKPYVCRYVHEIVATAFLGPRPSGYVIVHSDGNLLNNCVDNLVYKPRNKLRKRKREREPDSEPAAEEDA